MALASPLVPSNVTAPVRTHAQEIADLKAKLAEIGTAFSKLSAEVPGRIAALEKKVG